MALVLPALTDCRWWFESLLVHSGVSSATRRKATGADQKKVLTLKLLICLVEQLGSTKRPGAPTYHEHNPKKFKPRGVLKRTQAVSDGSRDATDFPPPINQRTCKAFVTNNRVNFVFKRQTDSNLTGLPVRQCAW